MEWDSDVEIDLSAFEDEPVVDDDVAQLVGMGFSREQSRAALRAHGGDIERAVPFLLAETASPPISDLQQLMNMGFGQDHAAAALEANGGSVGRAIEALLAGFSMPDRVARVASPSRPAERGVKSKRAAPANGMDNQLPPTLSDDEDGYWHRTASYRESVLNTPAGLGSQASGSSSSSSGPPIPAPMVRVPSGAPSRGQSSASSSSASGSAAPPPAESPSREFPTGSAPELFAPVSTDNPAKKRKTKAGNDADDSAQFVLRGNAGDAPASNPPRLQEHALREEQCRSLGWMVKQERPGRAVKGGILADKMGYGKTATTIGLMSLGSNATDKKLMQGVSKEYVPCNATLVLSPVHLVEQWQDEVVKFIGEQHVVIMDLSKSTETRLKKWAKDASNSSMFKMVVVRTHRSLQHIKGSFLQEADMVLVSYNVQASTQYQSRLTAIIDSYLTGGGRQASRQALRPGHSIEVHRAAQEFLADRENGEAYRRYSLLMQESAKNKSPMYGKTMKQRMAALRGVVEKMHARNVIQRRVLDQDYPVFELFWWKRIVMDEFHESESWQYRTREMFKGIGASCRWGLSGTPPVGNLSSIADVSSILWYEGAMNSTADAQKFLDGYVRQNTSALVEAIRIVVHLQHVEFTKEERILYRQACHDNGIFNLEDGYTEVSLESRAALLRRCSHFNMGDESASAGDEVQRLGQEKRRRIKDLEEQLHIEVERAHHLKAWRNCKEQMQSAARTALHLGARACVESILENPQASQIEKGKCFSMRVEHYDRNGELRQEPLVRLAQPVPESDYYPDARSRHAVVHWVAQQSQCQQNRDADERLSRLEMCSGICHGIGGHRVNVGQAVSAGAGALVGLVDAAHRSLQFYDQQLQSVTSGASAEDLTCSICLEEDCPLASLCILPCAHIFHTACIRACLVNQATCPECRQPVQSKDISALQLELKPLNQAAPKEPEVEVPLTPAQKHHGSKLSAVAATIRKIRAEDATAKSIVFVQWSDLEDKVEKALKAHGVPVLRFRARSQKQTASSVLKQFQEDSSAPYVLILSLEQAAAGTNLTAASHVLFVHPMNADTVSTAVAWEKQAIGRVRRIGQLRSEIHVYRFVARDTVEEHITRVHQQQI